MEDEEQEEVEQEKHEHEHEHEEQEGGSAGARGARGRKSTSKSKRRKSRRRSRLRTDFAIERKSLAATPLECRYPLEVRSIWNQGKVAMSAIVYSSPHMYARVARCWSSTEHIRCTSMPYLVTP